MQGNITSTGTITTGTWNGTAVSTQYGGTGQNFSASTGILQLSGGTASVSTALANGTTATTQTGGDNTTKVATDAFVTSAISGATIGTSQISGVIQISQGGTSQTTAAAARSSVGLNIDEETTHGDSNYTILATDRTVATSAALTAARVWTLPAANAVNAGQHLCVVDQTGGVTATTH